MDLETVARMSAAMAAGDSAAVAKLCDALGEPAGPSARGFGTPGRRGDKEREVASGMLTDRLIGAGPEAQASVQAAMGAVQSVEGLAIIARSFRGSIVTRHARLVRAKAPPSSAKDFADAEEDFAAGCGSLFQAWLRIDAGRPAKPSSLAPMEDPAIQEFLVRLPSHSSSIAPNLMDRYKQILEALPSEAWNRLAAAREGAAVANPFRDDAFEAWFEAKQLAAEVDKARRGPGPEARFKSL